MAEYTTTFEEVAARTGIMGVVALTHELKRAGVLDAEAKQRVGQVMLGFIDTESGTIDGAEHLRGWVAQHFTHGE